MHVAGRMQRHKAPQSPRVPHPLPPDTRPWGASSGDASLRVGGRSLRQGPRAAPKPVDYDVEKMSTDLLLLDASNPRLALLGEGKANDDLAVHLWKHFAVEEVALSIA